MQKEHKTFWEVVLSSGLGAGIATVAAVALGFPWWPAAIIGVGMGAFFCFRPGEVVGKMRAAFQVAHRQCDVFLALPPERKREGVKACARWTLLFIWVCLMIFFMGMSVAFVMVVGEVSIPSQGTFFEGVVFFGIIGGIPILLGMLLAVLIYEVLGEKSSICGWFLLRGVSRISYALIGIRPVGGGPYVLRAYWRFFDARERPFLLRVLSLAATSIAISTWMYWGAVLGLCFAIDAVMTLWLALASRPRLAVMWGTMIGGTIGYLTFVAQPTLPIATFVGMLAGGASGGALYCVRLRIVAALKAA